MFVENKIIDLGLQIPDVPWPIANYVPYKFSGNLIFISGVGPIINGRQKYSGKIGDDLSDKDGYNAAKLCGLNILSILKQAVGDLDKVNQIISINGFVNSKEGACNQPEVINGVSDLMVSVFGEKGKHARCAISCNDLPMNIPVEVTMIAEVNK